MEVSLFLNIWCCKSPSFGSPEASSVSYTLMTDLPIAPMIVNATRAGYPLRIVQRTNSSSDLWWRNHTILVRISFIPASVFLEILHWYFLLPGCCNHLEAERYYTKNKVCNVHESQVTFCYKSRQKSSNTTSLGFYA